MRKQYKIVPDAIVKKQKQGAGRRKVSGRDNLPFVEDVLQDIGSCCGVSQCDGTISHFPGGSLVRYYGIESGTFGPIAKTSPGPVKSKWMVDESIFTKDKESPSGRATVYFLENILNEQASCCGTNCGCGLIRLPNWDEGVIYEFGVDELGATQAPAVISTIDANARQGFKKKYKVIPDSIFKRGRRRMRSASPRIRDNVKYFEDVQEGMLQANYYGFDCCNGYIFLPDLVVADTYYRVSIVSDAFVLTQVDSCNNLIQ